MHEASIAKHLIHEIEQRVDEGQIVGTIISIFLRLGRLTAVVPENLRFMFSALAEGSPVEGARLEIEEVQVQARCRSCGAEWNIDSLCFRCHQCASPEIDILRGRELMIVGVEVE